MAVFITIWCLLANERRLKKKYEQISIRIYEPSRVKSLRPMDAYMRQ